MHDSIVFKLVDDRITISSVDGAASTSLSKRSTRRRVRKQTFKLIKDALLWHANFEQKTCVITILSFQSIFIIIMVRLHLILVADEVTAMGDGQHEWCHGVAAMVKTLKYTQEAAQLHARVQQYRGVAAVQ
jgi:hypothetical protein